MFDNFSDLINANNRAIAALNQCLGRLNQLTIGATSSTNARIQADISDTTSEIDLLNLSSAHLGAAGVPFQPLDQATLGELTTAFRRIDQAIIQNEIISASLDTISDIFEAAGKIRTITENA